MLKDKMKVVIHTNSCKLEAEIPTHEGFRGRLSDILNDGKMFLNLTHVIIYSLDNNEEINRFNFLCFNKSDIVFISPIEV